MKQDSVDRTLTEWVENAPDADVSGRHVVWRLQVVAKYIHDAMSELPTPDERLSSSAIRMLLHLIGMPEPRQASPTALSKRLLLTTPSMTSLIDRLEEFGYVDRRPDLADRRGILVRLTPSGEEVAQELLSAHIELEARILSPLDSEQRETLIELLRALILSYEASGWRVPEE